MNLSDKYIFILFTHIILNSEEEKVSTCADMSQEEKKKGSCVLCQVSHVTCHMSRVTCHLTPDTYHLSLMPTARDPHPAISPTMHSRLVYKDPKSKKIFKRKNQFSNISNTLFEQKSPARSVPVVNGGDIQFMDIATTRLNWPWGQFSQN